MKNYFYCEKNNAKFGYCKLLKDILEKTEHAKIYLPHIKNLCTEFEYLNS